MTGMIYAEMNRLMVHVHQLAHFRTTALFNQTAGTKDVYLVTRAFYPQQVRHWLDQRQPLAETPPIFVPGKLEFGND